MNEQKFTTGEIIYREGEPAEAVHFVQSGQVELLKFSGGEQVALATMGKGEVLGEMGVIRGEPHSTTARAVRSGTLLTITKDEFLAAFGTNDIALHVLRALCERLANADRSIVTGRPAEVADIPGSDEVAAIRLMPAGYTVEMQIGGDGILVDALPFSVGRHQGGHQGVSCSTGELLLSAPNAFELSPSHFAIETDGDGFVVRDLGSHLGTIVNGRRVSHFEHRRSEPLRLGSNEVIAGGIDSPFRFLVMLEPA